MKHHLSFIRYAMSETGEGFLVPLLLVGAGLAVSWIACIEAFGR